MNQTLVIQDGAIVIAAKEYKPNALNLELLKYTGTIPTDWKLQSSPIYTNSAAQVTFDNGISIIAETNRVMFLEAMVGKDAASVEVPAIARKYTQTLPNVEYQGIGINLRGHVAFDKQDAARKYLASTLLSPGSWQESGIAPMRATLNLAYTLERGTFYLSINEAALRSEDETTTPIVLFNGNFSYEITGNTADERQKSLCQAIENWQADFTTYSDIINTKFLNVAETTPVVVDVVPDAVPDLFAMSASAAA